MIPTQYETMSIASIGAPTLPKEQRRQFAGRPTNDTSDIEGSRPGNNYEKYANKPQFLQSDVDGSTSKQLIHTRNTPDLSLSIDDIPGTRHTIKDRMLRTRRVVNPLVPDYDFPKYTTCAPEVPKFIKDPQDHNDIDGSFTKVPRQYRMRDSLRVDDIEGAQVGWKPRHQVCRKDSEPMDFCLNTQDISSRTHRHIDRTNRVTNNMDPTYVVNGMLIVDDKYSKPRPSKAYIEDNHLLRTDDILGATSGWVKVPRTEIRNINNTMDIQGAQADTIKHSIITMRQSNPLNPVYQSLDDGAPVHPLNQSLIPAEMIRKPTWRPQSTVSKPINESTMQGSRSGTAPTVSSARLDSSSNVPMKSYAEKIENNNGPNMHLDLNKLTGNGFGDANPFSNNNFNYDFGFNPSDGNGGFGNNQGKSHENNSGVASQDWNFQPTYYPEAKAGDNAADTWNNMKMDMGTMDWSSSINFNQTSNKNLDNSLLPPKDSGRVSSRSRNQFGSSVGVGVGVGSDSGRVLTDRKKYGDNSSKNLPPSGVVGGNNSARLTKAAIQLQADIDAVRSLK